jgi:hypothetical protein
MSVSWEIRGRVVVLATEGGYEREELVSAVEACLADPGFKQGLFLLFDGRRSTAPLSTADIEWRVSWASTLPQKGFSSRIAIVAGPEPHRFGVGRMLSMRLEGDNVSLSIFRDFDEAVAWLQGEPGLPPKG